MSARRVKYDKHYADCDQACGEPFPEFVAFVGSLDAPASVLDLGCGQGRDALLFARAGHSVVGIDVSSVGIAQLRRVAEAEGLAVDARVADVLGFEADVPFDIVVLDRVLHMLASDDERRGVLAQACAATAPGGTLLVSEYPKQRQLLRDVFADQPDWTVLLDRKGFLFLRRSADS